MTLAESFEAYVRKLWPPDSPMAPEVRATLRRTFYTGAAAFGAQDPRAAAVERAAFVAEDEMAQWKRAKAKAEGEPP